MRKSRPERLHPSLSAYVSVFLSGGVPQSPPWWSVSFTCVECCLRHGRRWQCPDTSLGCVSSLRTKRVETLVSTARVYDTVHEDSMVAGKRARAPTCTHPGSCDVPSAFLCSICCQFLPVPSRTCTSTTNLVFFVCMSCPTTVERVCIWRALPRIPELAVRTRLVPTALTQSLFEFPLLIALVCD